MEVTIEATSTQVEVFQGFVLDLTKVDLNLVDFDRDEVVVKPNREMSIRIQFPNGIPKELRRRVQ